MNEQLTVHVIWMTSGLGCDGDTVAMTAATQPSLEDLLYRTLPGTPGVALYNPFLAVESGRLEDKVRVSMHSASTRGSSMYLYAGQTLSLSELLTGLMLRSGTPAAVVDNILRAAKAAHADPDVRAKLELQGFDVSGQTGPEFAADV